MAVAEKMKQYITMQKAAGKNLLFIASVGDNFYWSGVTPASWAKQWANVYGAWDPSSPMYHVPWLAVLGNHDLGNTDPFVLCPHVKPLGTVNGQHYGSQQFNADRNPTRPDHGCHDPAVVSREPARCRQNTSFFWLPDYSYHYELPEASLEVISIDTNWHAVGSFGGDATGHARAFAGCGGQAVVQHHFLAVGKAARELLKARARANTANTVVISQHYPGHCMKEVFEGALPPARKGQVKVLCVYGHTHDQKCDGNDPETGVCTMIMTGGGGGCCGPEVNLGGFSAIHLEDDGGFVSDVDSEHVRFPFGQCKWAGMPAPIHASPNEVR